MQIKNLTGKELKQAATLVPDYILREATLVLGCETKENLAGVAVLMKRDDDWVVTWLYVEEEYRRRGYGNALLDGAVAAAKNTGAASLSMDLNGDSEGGRLAAAMLTKRFFRLHFERVARIRVTKEQFGKAVFFTDAKLAGDGKRLSSQVLSLRELKSAELAAFLEECEKRGNYLVSRADYRGADSRKSKALVYQGQIVGVLLLERTGEKLYTIQLSYVEKKHQMEFVSLIRAAGRSLQESESEWENLEFVCMDSSILQLAKHLFPEREIRWDCMITGERWL